MVTIFARWLLISTLACAEASYKVNGVETHNAGTKHNSFLNACNVEAVLGSVGGARDAFNAGMDFFAASKRCTQKGTYHIARCEVDLSDAIHSVVNMINKILSIVNTCGVLNIKDRQCGLEIATLTSYVTGLGGAGGKLGLFCVPKWRHRAEAEKASAAAAKKAAAASAGKSNSLMSKLKAKLKLPKMKISEHAKESLKCSADVGTLALKMFQASLKILGLKKACKPGAVVCAENAFMVSSSLAAVADALAESIGNCQIAAVGEGKADMTESAICAKGAAQAFQYLTYITKSSLKISHVCGAKTDPFLPLASGAKARLYEDDAAGQKSSRFATLVLVGLLPVSALMGFAFGRRYAPRRETFAQMSEELHSQAREDPGE